MGKVAEGYVTKAEACNGKGFCGVSDRRAASEWCPRPTR